MPEVATFTPGAPVWVDISTRDLERAKAFYSRLFGWEPHVTEDPQAGGYTMFTLNGKEVAAAGPTQMPDQPTAWMVYFGTEDIDAALAQVQELGGIKLAGPIDIGIAKLGVVQDPQGATFALYAGALEA